MHRLTGKSIDGAADSVRAAVQYMRVNWGRFDAAVAEKFLNRTDVVAALQKVRGETVPYRCSCSS
jgi:hypothetical protein